MTGTWTSQSAQTPLHRADPRLKLLVCGLSVILAFAADDGRHLAVVGMAVLTLCVSNRCGPGWILRTLWPFRWLLLFTLLLHLFFTPGLTLFGFDWLSADGLVRGMLVCGQIGVAALTASLLTATTAAEQTAQACGWLLAPLSRLGCPVRQWEELMALVLRFFPVLREELRTTAISGDGRWHRRIQAWEERLLPLLDRLVERADLLARRIVAGEEVLWSPQPLPPLGLLFRRNALLLGGTLVTLAVYAAIGWGAGG